MYAHVERLFQYARAGVSAADIIAYSPRDPGYLGYVQLWTQIHRSGTVPQEADFDLSEVIALTAGFGETADDADLFRFRAYRRFTSAVGLMLIHLGNDTERVRPGNYLARDLIIDVVDTEREHLDLVRAVLSITRDLLVVRGDEEYPFFTFGTMILAQKAGDWNEAAKAAARLIEDEDAVRRSNPMITGDRFLLDLTVYDQLHADWLRWAMQLKNPAGDDSTRLIIDCFESCMR